VALAADHEVIEQVDIDQSERLGDFEGDGAVGFAGLTAARGMVMANNPPLISVVSSSVQISSVSPVFTVL